MIVNILILRAEFICIIILLFLLISNIHYNVGKDSRTAGKHTGTPKKKKAIRNVHKRK